MKRIPESAIHSKAIGFLSNIERKIHGLTTPRGEEPHVNLKYYDKNFECFSAWQVNELKAFSSFITKFSNSHWTDIGNSGGKRGRKKGFGLTYHKDRSKLPSTVAVEKVSMDIKFFELRISQKLRVHGFRSVSSFFLVWLDRKHRIYPS